MTRVMLAVAVAGWLAVAPAPAQEPPPLPADGYELFRGVLGFYGFQAVPDPADLHPSDYRNTCVVLIGRPGHSQLGLSRLVVNILEAGGTALIAVDTPGPIGEFLPGYPDVEVLDGVVTNQTPYANYLNRADRPLLSPWGSRFDLVHSSDRLASRRPAVMRVAPTRRLTLTPLAGFPTGAVVVRADGSRSVTGFSPVVVAGVGSAPTPFHCIIVSDPDMFSNRLLVGTEQRGGETDNLKFAARVSKFLKPVGVERPKCLFVEAGEPRGDFDKIGLYELGNPPPMPPLPSPLDPAVQAKLTDVVNAGIDKLQSDDRPDHRLAGTPDRFERFMQVLAGVLAAVAAVWMVRRAWAGRHDPDRPPVPADAGRSAASGGPGSLGRRREELIQSGDYTRPVREYLNDLFTRQGLPPDEYRHPRSLPPLAVAGADARAIRSALRILWEAAYGPGGVSYSRWKELEPMIAVVQRAAGDGRWRFATGGNG